LTPAATAIVDLLKLPKFFKKAISFLTRKSDPLSSELSTLMHQKTVLEDRENIVKRDQYRALWHKKWIDEGLDFVITVPYSLPALEHGASEKTTLISAGYTFLFSLASPISLALAVTN